MVGVVAAVVGVVAVVGDVAAVVGVADDAAVAVADADHVVGETLAAGGGDVAVTAIYACCVC